MSELKCADGLNATRKFFIDVERELERAEQKFPQGTHLLAALVEEVGEAAKALLKISESGESPQNAYNELVQVATMALRLATQGDREFGYKGTSCYYANCDTPAIGGPCPLCYE